MMCKFIFSILIFCICSGCLNKKENTKIISNISHDNCCSKYVILQEHFMARYKNENIRIYNIEKYLKHKNKGVLIVRIFGNYCGDCLDSTIVTINRFIDKKNFIVLGSNIPPRYMKYKFGNNFRLIDDDEIKIPIEKQQMPYLFYYDHEKSTKHIVFIDKTTLGLLEQYCTTINNLYFNKK